MADCEFTASSERGVTRSLLLAVAVVGGVVRWVAQKGNYADAAAAGKKEGNA